MSYQQVAQALKDGADPAMLCLTCPWDRFCVQSPTMTQAELEAKMDEASRQDEEQARTAELEGKRVGLPVRLLLTAATMTPHVTKAEMCPVLALGLRLPEGQQIAGVLKQYMQTSH